MTPNLFLATQTLFKPHKWFKAPKTERPKRETEFQAEPVPGLYEYIPGRGKYLIATLKDAPTEATELKSSAAASLGSQEFTRLDVPIPITYAKALKRWLLEPDNKSRKKTGLIKNAHGKQVAREFYRTDDCGGIVWVQCWDLHGIFIPGPWQRWVIDADSKEFRHMRRRDDPSYVQSRSNSTDHDAETRSQQSVSTEYRPSRPGSTRNGPSGPSTRASSIRFLPSNPTSATASQRPSRQNSPKRNDSIALEEAKAALRRMAREQQEAAAARSLTNSKDRIERGRPMVRVGN